MCKAETHVHSIKDGRVFVEPVIINGVTVTDVGTPVKFDVAVGQKVTIEGTVGGRVFIVPNTVTQFYTVTRFNEAMPTPTIDKLHEMVASLQQMQPRYDVIIMYQEVYDAVMLAIQPATTTLPTALGMRVRVVGSEMELAQVLVEEHDRGCKVAVMRVEIRKDGDDAV